MARQVSFGGNKPKKVKAADPFPFGANVMSAKEKKAYRARLRKAGHSTGGS